MTGMDLPAAFVGFLIVFGFSSFVKIATSLSILRFGLGLSGMGFGLVTAVLAFVLSLVVLEPHLEEMGGVQGIFSSHHSINVTDWEQRFRPFLDKNTDMRIRERLERVVSKDPAQSPGEGSPTAPSNAPAPKAVVAQDASSTVVLASFLVSQLHEAFRLGLLFIVPFVVLDLLIANILMALGMREFSYQVVSFPLKLLLFFSIDGWALVTTKLLGGYF